MSVDKKIIEHVETQKQISMMDCTYCFAVRGANSMIDVVHPITGKTFIYGRTLEECRQEKGYENAELMLIDDFCRDKAARQDTKIEWIETTEEKYIKMLEVLPPAMWVKTWFLVGEPYDHHATTGQPRFSAFREVNGKFEHANRPITRTELKKEMESCL
jgi:hypothetical protein